MQFKGTRAHIELSHMHGSLTKFCLFSVNIVSCHIMSNKKLGCRKETMRLLHLSVLARCL